MLRRAAVARLDWPMKGTDTMEASTPSADASARDRLAQSLKQMVDEAEQLLKTAQRTGSEQFNLARDKFESQLRHAKSELEQLEESAAYQARRAARATDQAVHEHPYAAMGLAAGVGLLIGMLITRR
jgi:ElaB/YqjD/DUF883 family membrane-anchored ribosome-binding protein